MSKQSDPTDTHPTPTSLSLSDAMLQAYVDGQLSEVQAAQVEALLAHHPELAARVAGYRHLNRDLHACFDSALDEAVPQRLVDVFATAAASAAPHAGKGARLRGLAGRLLAPAWLLGGWRLPACATTLAWLGMGVAVGWQLQQALPRDTLPPMVKHAAVAYVTYANEALHPVEIQASEEAHLVAWLSKRLGIDIKAAKLDRLGFTLMGGRLLAGTQRPVAQFMYEDRVGRRLTLYVKTQESGYDQSAAFRFAQDNDVKAFYWISNGTGYVLSGNLDRPDLLKLAEAVHRQLNAAAAVPGHPAPLSPARLNGKAT